MMVSLSNWARRIHKTAVDKGFWGPVVQMDQYQAKLMLVVTEVAEITEALRKNQGEAKVTEEFADLIIRALDVHQTLANEGLATPDLALSIQSKMEKNDRREALHGHIWG